MPNYCPTCNAELTEDVAVCPECGNPIEFDLQENESVNNADAISQLFNNAQDIIKNSEKDNDFIGDDVEDDIPEDVVKDFNTGKPIDLSIADSLESDLIDATEFDVSETEFDVSETEFDEIIIDEEMEEEQNGVKIKIAESKDDIMFGIDGERIKEEYINDFSEDIDFLVENEQQVEAETIKKKKLFSKKENRRSKVKPKKSKKLKPQKKKSDKDMKNEGKNIDNDTNVKRKKNIFGRFLKKKTIPPIEPDVAVDEQLEKENVNSSDVDFSFDNNDISPDDEASGDFNLADELLSSIGNEGDIMESNNDNSPLSGRSRLIRAVIFILATVVSFALGAAIIYLNFNPLYKNSVYDDANKFVKAVTMKMPDNSRLIVYDVYVKPGQSITECIINGVLSTGIGTYETTYYRVVQEENKITIYYPFDEIEYNKLLAGNDQDKISADILLNRYHNYLSAIEEINNGDNKWIKANANFINSNE